MPTVNPDIMKWARETSGHTLESAAAALAIGSSKGQSGAERLASIEGGTGEVSRTLLKKMSEKYRRSLLVFYLAERPQKGDRGRDFRTRPGATSGDLTPTLDTLVRDLRARQDLIRSVLEDDQAEPLAFVGSCADVSDPEQLARRISATLGFSLSGYRAKADVSKAFAYLREKIEALGVFVLLAGNLGSHHTNIHPSEFSGYAIADSVAPFIVINDQDARSAWTFTALHELAHIFLGATGISVDRADNAVERICNTAASLILLPENNLDEIPLTALQDGDRTTEALSAKASEWKVSRSMIAYRLLLAKRISQSAWKMLDGRFRREWEESKANKPKADDDSSGPTYYIVRRHRLGRALLNTVKLYLQDGSISQTKAGRVLGVKPRNVAPLLREPDYSSNAA